MHVLLKVVRIAKLSHVLASQQYVVAKGRQDQINIRARQTQKTIVNNIEKKLYNRILINDRKLQIIYDHRNFFSASNS